MMQFPHIWLIALGILLSYISDNAQVCEYGKLLIHYTGSQSQLSYINFYSEPIPVNYGILLHKGCVFFQWQCDTFWLHSPVFHFASISQICDNITFAYQPSPATSYWIIYWNLVLRSSEIYLTACNTWFRTQRGILRFNQNSFISYIH